MNEAYKGSVHTVAFGVGLVLLAYNLGEFLETHDREHAVNTAVYGLFCAWEIGRVIGHCR